LGCKKGNEAGSAARHQAERYEGMMEFKRDYDRAVTRNIGATE
jgi:hypothetical protein